MNVCIHIEWKWREARCILANNVNKNYSLIVDRSMTYIYIMYIYMIYIRPSLTYLYMQQEARGTCVVQCTYIYYYERHSVYLYIHIHTHTRVCFRYILEKYVPYFRGRFDSWILKNASKTWRFMTSIKDLLVRCTVVPEQTGGNCTPKKRLAES